MREIPEAPDSAVDVELSRGKGAVFVLVDSGPADDIVEPTVDPVARMEVVELLSGSGGEAVVAEDAAVPFRRAAEDVVRELVGPGPSGADNVVLVDPAVDVEGGPVSLTRVPVGKNTEVVLVKGNGAGLVLPKGTLVVPEVDLLVVRVREVLVVVDNDNTVCEPGSTVDVVLFGDVEELEVAGIVLLGVKIDRGNVLRVDIWEVVLTWLKLLGVAELFSVRLPTDGNALDVVGMGEDVMGGKLVSMVTLVRFADGEGLKVRVGPEVTAAEELLLAGAVPEVVKTAEEFLEKEFLSVKLAFAELSRGSALVSVAPDSVDESFEGRLIEVVAGVKVGVGVEVDVDVATITVVDVLEVGMVVTCHGPFVCWPWCGCLQCGCECHGQ